MHPSLRGSDRVQNVEMSCAARWSTPASSPASPARIMNTTSWTTGREKVMPWSDNELHDRPSEQHTDDEPENGTERRHDQRFPSNHAPKLHAGTCRPRAGDRSRGSARRSRAASVLTIPTSAMSTARSRRAYMRPRI